MKNISQNEAIAHFKGPCLVLAGPGSGKTYTLTNRVYQLIKEHHIKSDNILVVTFTRMAAREMKERFFSLCKNANLKYSDYENVKFGTFHSIFFEILRNDFNYNPNSILKYEEKLLIFKNILEYLHSKKDVKISKLFANIETCSDIDTIKTLLNEFLDYKSAIQNHKSIKTKNKLFEIIFVYYMYYCKKNKKLDYDDMISVIKENFENNVNILHKYQSQYQFILIDEFQDINTPQYEIMKMLSHSKNIFCVGDDDQSIYNFRGVSPKIMQQFTKDYKTAKIINLNINYRSPQTIIKYALNVISHNKLRFNKKLLPQISSKGLVEIKSFQDYKEENLYIIKNIKLLLKTGLPYNEMAILYRTNTVPMALIEALKKENIPINVKDKIFNIYDTFYIKDILSYLSIFCGKASGADYYRIANKPLRYITRQSLGRNPSIDSLLKYYRFTPYMLSTLKQFKQDIQKGAILPSAASIEYIKKNIGYNSYLTNYCKEHQLNYDEIQENIDAFQDEALNYPKIFDFLHYCKNSQKYITEISNQARRENQKKNAVNLMTFHSSKGLEFTDVQIIDANNGIIPHKKSIAEGEIESERRLFYVALTRAKQNLHIYFTNIRYAKKQIKSQFIEEGFQ